MKSVDKKTQKTDTIPSTDYLIITGTKYMLVGVCPVFKSYLFRCEVTKRWFKIALKI